MFQSIVQLTAVNGDLGTSNNSRVIGASVSVLLFFIVFLLIFHKRKSFFEGARKSIRNTYRGMKVEKLSFKRKTNVVAVNA